jgi:hypothetical protein
MGHFLAIAILSSVALAQGSSSSAASNPAQDPSDRTTLGQESTLSVLPNLPPTPQGKSTVIGGAIREVDTVRDQFTLNVFGGRTLKILFDERTQVYRDGQKAPLRVLRAGDHVSVETMLDGTTVFARSVHMLSQLPEGECQGQVVNYNPGDGELTVRDALSREPVKMRVPAGSAIVGQGQAVPGSAHLIPGTLVSVRFRSDTKGHAVVSQISILATPGTAFMFVGKVVFLDLPSGRLALVDPGDDKRYEIFFDSARFPMSRDLHEGADVAVTATFDGARYVATALTVNSASDH